jgi:tRNA(fMet)-specific endonuclease VapC
LETKVVLDTGVILNFFTNTGEAGRVENLVLKKNAIISSITVFELSNGIIKTKHLENRRKFIELCEVYSITKEIALEASQIYTTMRKKGITINNEDILIGATALNYRLPLLTNNKKHFLQIRGIELF